MAKPDLGSKRQCHSCGTKFFDLNKDPIVCPKCGAVFQLATAVRPQPRAAAVEDETGADSGAVELVSLEDADSGDDKAAAVGDDIEIEDDGSPDETFLEEEEEGTDDVADLIDGEIEDDEEA